MMIEFKKVEKHYHQRPVLADISMQIPSGSIVVLIGLSGCGKTTTLKMINRLVKPSAGEIVINGKDIRDWDPIKLRRQIGYVIQQTGLFPHMTVRENIQIILKLEKNTAECIENRTEELMDMVGLELSMLDLYPSQLSGGQQQRVGVARAFATNPAIILMDEPFSALDPLTRSDLQDGLITLHEKVQKTIVFVTHDMDEAIKIADYICIMDKGNIIQYDTPEEILRNPCNDFVAEFIGKNRVWASPEHIKIKDIMIEGPLACNSSLSLSNCLKRMRSHRVDSLMVVEERTQTFLGVIRASQAQRHFDKKETAGALMKSDVLIVRPDDSILDVLQHIQDKRKVNVPVVSEEGKLVGLLTKSNLITTLSQQYFDDETED